MMIEMLMTWWWWSMFFISLTRSLTRSLSFSLTCRFFRLLDSPSDDHCCPMTGKQFQLLLLWWWWWWWRCWWRDDDDRCFSSHSLNHSLALSPFISPSITLFLNLCSDSVLFSLWHALVEITTFGSPSIHHCCLMTGKQFWCCCYSDADDVMMMIDVFHLTHSITHSLSHPFTHCCSSYGLLGCVTSSIRVHWSRRHYYDRWHTALLSLQSQATP